MFSRLRQNASVSSRSPNATDQPIGTAFVYLEQRRMKRVMKAGVLILAFGIVSSLGTCGFAEELDLSALDVERDSTYYQTQTYRPNPRAIVHEKAQTRAYQRQARMASMQWYGMSNSRPQAASTPFTSRYSPVWEMAGGKPYSWYPTYHWPVYYVR
jgi:hypothetical protein